MTTPPARTVPGRRLGRGPLEPADPTEFTGQGVIAELGSQLARIGRTFAVLDPSSTV
ncbi:hypothetical protein [Rhodococcoides navarretei]|uniref:Uncharacterized protein n=1 Tax=Rhodococcus navarretei TaxID=3128981 RepID=A0ABU9CVP1_9NOCA